MLDIPKSFLSGPVKSTMPFSAKASWAARTSRSIQAITFVHAPASHA